MVHNDVTNFFFFFDQQFITQCSFAVCGRLSTTSSLQFLPQETETLFIGIDTIRVNRDQREIYIRVAHNQLTNYVSKSRETYHTEITESKETERRKLRNYL